MELKYDGGERGGFGLVVKMRPTLEDPSSSPCPLLTPASHSYAAQEAGGSPWVAATHVGDTDGAPGFGLAQSGLLQAFEGVSQQTEDLSPPPLPSAFK